MNRLFILLVLSSIFIGGRSFAKGGEIFALDLPATQFVGDVFDVDLIVRGQGDQVGPSLSSYNLTLLDGNSLDLMRFVGFSFTGNLGAGAITSLGPLGTFELSFSETSILDAIDLDLQQPSEFVVATITFEAVAAGTTIPVASFGEATLTAGTTKFKTAGLEKRVLTILPANAVPEPESFLILLIGLVGLIGASRSSFLQRFLARGVQGA